MANVLNEEKKQQVLALGRLTWTFGLRDTYNSNPLNPHDQIARLKVRSIPSRTMSISR
jgi:TRAP-type C4-dicarboxylate transport system substrate-binding protein